MKNSLVSIIVPTFNRAYCLRRAIDSALAQTHRRVEVLLVDDGSTDNTRELVAERYGSVGRVRYIHQPNQGVSAARNRALALAEGDYVAFLDSDDYWEPWKLELQVACLERFPALRMVWSDMKARNPAGAIAYPRYLRKMYGAYRWFTNGDLFAQSLPLTNIVPQLSAHVGTEHLRYGNIYSAMIMGSLVHTSTVLLRRTAAAENAGFNPEFRVGEDYDYHLRTCKLGPVGLVDLPTIEYQIDRPDRLTRAENHLTAALNFLHVIQRELAEAADRITLPKPMRNAVLAEAHAWVGYELLKHNRPSEARRHFWHALWHNPWHPGTMRQLALSCLPAHALDSIRQGYHRLKEAPQIPG